MLKDGPRKLGRFIKKGSPVLKKIALEEFSFSDINTTNSVEQDNSRRTIVHAKYHSDEELSTIRTPRKFEDDLAHLDGRHPIIFPTDFTGDWEREKKMRKDRHQRQDEDDDFSYNDPYESQKNSGYDLTQQNVGVDEMTPSQSAGAKRAAAPRSQQEDDESEITRLHTPLKIAAPTIKEFAQNSVDDRLGSHFSIGAVPHSNAASAPQKQATPSPPQAPAQAPLNLEEALNPKAVPTTSDFIPNEVATEGVDPEQAAADAYKQRIVQEKLDQQEVQAIYEEANARGFQDGFRAGEEKGELQVRNNARELFSKVQGLVESFMELKSTVLSNVQENFYTISQAVAEALLKREFSIAPETFATVVRKAIDDAVAPNQFKIRVHPAMAERLQKISDKDFLKHLVKDSSVDDGDFKIESELSVIDVNMTKLVSELIEQADISLFDDSEKAG